MYFPTGFPKVSIVAHFDSDTREPWSVSYGDIAKLAGCEYEELFSSYLDNLFRLGLLEIHNRNAYPDINEDTIYAAIKKELQTSETLLKMRYGAHAHADSKDEFISFTSLGRMFVDACIIVKDKDVGSEKTSSESSTPPPQPSGEADFSSASN